MMDKEDLSGRKLGEYVLRGLLDEGGYGAVYSCEQPQLGREAVVKVLHPRLRGSGVMVQRFMREAQLASRLDHPYAAHIYAFGIEKRDRLIWIAMERVHGVTLHKWLNKHGPMPLGLFVAFFERIAKVVQTAHESGIVHRDLKPSNVMLIERARELLPKLLDFGVAKLIEDAVLADGTPDIIYPRRLGNEPAGKSLVSSAPDMVTATGAPGAPGAPGTGGLTRNHQTVGSPPYMSPEQWSNPITVGPASDLYALAVVAFEALTGRRPFQAATVADIAELHCHGKVPPLGGSFPPALDRMLQRALAKRPEDRWGTALELADALRSASGIGTSQPALPRIDVGVRDAWLGDAPQPLAELVAALDDAHNANQARNAAQELVRHLLRYLLAVALATRPRAAGDDDPSLLELVRAMSKRDLSARERLQLLRLLVRPHRIHPIPELLDLVTPFPDGTDALEPILVFYSITDCSGSEDSVRRRMRLLFPVLNQLLHKMTFLLDHVLVVPRGGVAERWTGQRQAHRIPATVTEGELVDGHPMLLDRNGRICADLWPLMQAAPPSDDAEPDAEPELFVFDGRSRHGAELIAARRGFVRDDSAAWTWIVTHLIDEVETKARLGDQVRTAARQWEDRGRLDALLLRGEVLKDAVRWTRSTSAVGLAEPAASFVAASLGHARRGAWIRSVLVATAAAGALAWIMDHEITKWQQTAQTAQQETRIAQLQTSAAEQLVTQAHVEQGRAALLHGESSEAVLHLEEAYRRDDHSAAVTFMLARALQPRMSELGRLTSSSGRTWSAMFSPDGKRIVTTDDKSAQMWDAGSNRLLFTMSHGDTVYRAVYSPDGSRIITAGGDGTVRIWNATTGAPVRELTPQRSDAKQWRYSAVATSSHFVAAIDTMGRAAHVWDTDTGTQIAELKNDASEKASLALSADGHWLATSGGNDVRVFDTSTWRQMVTIDGPRVRSLTFDPTGPRLAVGTYDGIASIWEIPSGVRLRSLREAGESVDAIAFSRDGKLVATGSREGAEQVWDATSGGLRTQFNSHHSKINAVEFSSTGNLMLSAGSDGAVVVSNVATGMPVARLEGPKSLVFAAHFDPESRRVVGASFDGTARVWDVTSPYRRWDLPPIGAECNTEDSLEPDQRFIALSCRNHGTHVWDTARGNLLAELPSVATVDGDYDSAFPALTATGDRAAIARGNMVEVYALPSGQLVRTIAHPAAVNAVAFAPAGHDLVSGAVDGSLMITRDDHEPIALPTSSAGIDAAAILADGRVVAADASARLRVVDADRNALLMDLVAPSRTRLLRPSPDGTRLITLSTTREQAPPALWDLDQHRLVAQLDGHVGRVFAARFVSSGHEILTAGADGTARLWNAATGSPHQSFHGDSHFLVDATLDPSGTIVVAGGSDGLLRFWDVSSGRLLWTLQAHKSYVIGVHYEGSDIVSRGFAGDVSRWTLPPPDNIIEACNASTCASAALAGKQL